MFKRMILLLTCLAAVCTASIAFAETTETGLDVEIQNGIAELELEEWQDTIDSLAPEFRSLLSNSIDQQLMDTAMYGLHWNDVTQITSLHSLAASELKAQAAFFCTIIGISLVGGIVNACSTSERHSLNKILIFIFYCFVACIAVTKFSNTVSVGRETVNAISGFIETASPLLLTLLNTVGAISGSGIIHPAMAFLTGFVTIMLENIVIPLILIGGALSVLNHFTGQAQLEQLSRLTKSGTKWVLGLMFTLYTGVVVLQGISVKAVDGLSVRTAKFAADRFIPVVGGMVSGTLDTVLSCSVLIKNAAGVTAIILTALISALPLFRIGINIFAFRIAAALCEPISDSRVPKLFATIADMLVMLFAAIVVLCVMFVITIGIVIGMNGSAGGI